MNHLELVGNVASSTGTAGHDEPAAGTASFMRRRVLNGFILALGDATTLLLLTTVGISLEWMATGIPNVPVWMGWLPAVWVAGGLVAGLYPGWGMGRLRSLRRMLGVFTIVFSLISVGTLLTGETVSIAFLATCSTSFAALPITRARTQSSLQDTGDWGIPVVVFGAGDLGRRTLRHFRRERGLGFNPVAVVDDNPARHGRVVNGLRVLGRAGDRVPACRAAVVAMPLSPRRSELIDRLASRYEKVIVLDDATDGRQSFGQLHDFDGLLGIAWEARLDAPAARFSKRALELALITLASPIWLFTIGFTALAVWLEDLHTPFTRQVRIGSDGTPFTQLRFRTIVPNSGETLRERLHQDESLRNEWQTRFRLVDDPRVTRLGPLLRFTGLDGLPQVFNVLRGEMALVGPEPMPPYRYARLSERDAKARRHAAPGMTGLWKIYDDERETAPSDAYYVYTWSAGRDLALLLLEWVDLLTPKSE